jgi:OFA family oxalate/formate antiporter-like MFS transporter
LLVPLASILSTTGGWNLVFIVSAVVTIAAAVCAKFILAPMRSRWIGLHNAPAAAANGPSRLTHWPEQTGE